MTAAIDLSGMDAAELERLAAAIGERVAAENRARENAQAIWEGLEAQTSAIVALCEIGCQELHLHTEIFKEAVDLARRLHLAEAKLKFTAAISPGGSRPLRRELLVDVIVATLAAGAEAAEAAKDDAA